jgi:hypothetical protein
MDGNIKDYDTDLFMLISALLAEDVDGTITSEDI